MNDTKTDRLPSRLLIFCDLGASDLDSWWFVLTALRSCTSERMEQKSKSAAKISQCLILFDFCTKSWFSILHDNRNSPRNYVYFVGVVALSPVPSHRVLTEMKVVRCHQVTGQVSTRTDTIVMKNHWSRNGGGGIVGAEVTIGIDATSHTPSLTLFGLVSDTELLKTGYHSDSDFTLNIDLWYIVFICTDLLGVKIWLRLNILLFSFAWAWIKLYIL